MNAEFSRGSKPNVPLSQAQGNSGDLTAQQGMSPRRSQVASLSQNEVTEAP